MRSNRFIPVHALIAGGLLVVAGCATSPDHPRSSGGGAYDSTGSDPEYTDFRRRQAYRHCKESGGSDCDDLLKHD